ncbi:hypothetical protein GV054_13375 [Marinomonas mediterranea]|uniref:hypothetical protein n=1 Tax=Marinomonas mediterranea TaxID=119864 RepID=UPI002349E16C|nr:hypothetical protein [Marinomonas mediterranea]WCN13917.1 hypothetical protein GV054_13375 [Marinomonas mediterranea]
MEKPNVRRRLPTLIQAIVFVLLCGLYGCSLQLVSPFDPTTESEIQQIEKDIDYFYLTMRSIPTDERLFAAYSNQYIKIDVQIRSLARRQLLREKNQETIKQTQILEAFWQQDMKDHKSKSVLSDFIIKRRLDQYHRLLNALLRGELAKKN